MATASPAQAAAPACHGGSCTGKSPKATGCDRDALTMWEFSNGLTRVELRYSFSCDAVWARWTVLKSHTYSDEVHIRRYKRDNRGFHETKDYRTFTKIKKGKQGWTEMIGMPRSGAYFKACDLRTCTPYWPVP
ncbi:MAG: YjfA family protein [Acidobacteria bacterium]|nr:YjfA family protein [Acidobacteriota bacterium]